jgi:ATP-dependent Lhr-like helicase
MIRYVDIKKPKEDEKVLALLRPYVREWFKRNFKELIIHQKFAVELIHKGKNTLITAPTGSGKTLSSFLSILDHLFRLAEEGKLEDAVYCVYISPLKALDNDIHRNLLVPLKEIREIAKEMGIDLQEVRIGVRTGDTPANEKQKQLKKPPHILVTTPETIAIVLSTRKFKEKFRNVKWLVVDEIHELANSKRGVHLSLSLERLQNFVGKDIVRIGLGACLRKNQKIWLNSGMKSIGDFVEELIKKSPARIFLRDGTIGCDVSHKNIYTYAFDGEKICKKKILKVWKIPSPSFIGKIETTGGRKLFLTLNDKLLVLGKDGYEWKTVDKIKEKEKICCPLKLNSYGRVKVEEVLDNKIRRVWKKLRCVGKFAKFHRLLKKLGRNKGISLKELCKKKRIDPSLTWKIKFLSSLSLFDFYKICEILNLNFWEEIKKLKISGKRPLKKIKLPSISGKFLRFLGLVASDGHNNGNLVSLINKNKEICELTRKLMKEEFGIDGRVKLRKLRIGNYWQFTVKSRALCEILDIFGIKIGKKFKKIDLPEILLKLPNSVLLEFVYGFMDGDGKVSLEKGNKVRVGIHSTSEKIIDKIRYILLRSGISCSKEIEKRRGKENDLFVTRISNNRDAFFLARHTIKGRKLGRIKIRGSRSEFVPIGKLLKEFEQEKKLGFEQLDNLFGVYTFDIVKRGYVSRSTLYKILKNGEENGVPSAFIKKLKKIYTNNLTTDTVRKVEKITFKDKYVYDITVEDAHNFVAEGIIVHNTLEPLDEVARFLVGYDGEKERDCTVLDARFVKPMDIKVLSPVKDIVYTPGEEITNSMYKLLNSMIAKHKTTLVFTNTRSGTERVVHHLKQMFPSVYSEEDIGAHHSSVSREIRLELEEKLKKGLLKAIISSTSLELGIDIGYIDLVVQLGSPKSIARGLQRIGRAGHKLTETSVGRIICMDRDDLVETAVMFKKAYEYFLDKIQIPRNCLDVLAQHLMGMSLEKKWKIKEAFKLIRNSYCYRDLKWQDFLSVLEYLSGAHHSLEDKKVYGKIWVDFKDMVFGRRGKYARVIYSLNIGTIPDEVKIKVKSLDGHYIGSIEEEFLQRLVPGDIFVLAGKTYQFVRARQANAFVVSVKEKRPTVPSWFSEQLPLSFELAIEVGKFRKKIFGLMKEKTRREIVEWLFKNYPVNEWAARAIVEYYYYQAKFLEKMSSKSSPSHERILVENYIDERGNQNIIFHSLYGRRVNDALSRAFAYALTKKIGKSIAVTISDNGFMLTIPAETLESGWLFINEVKEIKTRRVKPEEILKLVKAKELEEILKKALRQTELVKRKFRHSAVRALMILRNYKGYEIRVAKQQLNADRLIKACEKIENFPVLKETFREVLEDYMDIRHAKEILEKIEKKKIKVEFLKESDLPSPFSHSLIALGESDVVLMEDRKKLLLELHKKVLEGLKK